MEQREEILMINTDLIKPNENQPRKFFNEESLKELALSIKQYGILNPIIVRKKDNSYEIIAGERRYRASKMVGLTEIPVIVKEVPENTVTEIALIENLQREDISPIEEAKTYEKILISSNKTEQELSKMVGKSQSFISNKLRLLKLPSDIQEALVNRKISERHARSLLTVKDENKQLELLNRIITEKLSVRDLDNIINEKEITKEEIEKAIDEIMQSLNIEQKEEKESDNMNNGNFFPNYNINMPTQDMAQINQPVQEPISQIQQDTSVVPNPMNEIYSQPVNNSFTVPPVVETPIIPTTPVIDTPLFNQNIQPTEQVVAPIQEPVINPQPVIEEQPLFNFDISQPSIAPTINPVEKIETPIMPTTPVIDTPLFNQNIQPTVGEPLNISMPEPMDIPLFSASTVQNETPVVPSTPIMQDTPLFTSSVEEPLPVSAPEPETIQPTSAPQYEIPVITPVQETIEVPQYQKVEELLKDNGINYKSYSNETGHCIIIEI